MVSNTSETLLKERNYWVIGVVIALLLCWTHVYTIKVNWKSELKVIESKTRYVVEAWYAVRYILERKLNQKRSEVKRAGQCGCPYNERDRKRKLTWNYDYTRLVTWNTSLIYVLFRTKLTACTLIPNAGSYQPFHCAHANSLPSHLDFVCVFHSNMAGI